MLNIEKPTVSGTIALEMLALEAENSSNILQSAVNLIPNVIGELSSSLTSLTEVAKTFSLTDIKQRISASFIKTDDVPEVVLKKFFIPVPEGFIGNVADYQESLGLAVDYYQDVTAVMLKEFYTQIAAFVTNKDRKLSLKDDSSKYKGFEATRNSLTKEISEHFNKGNTGRTLFHDAYKDYPDFKQATKNNIGLLKKMNQFDLKGIAGQVKRIADTLDLAMKSAERGDYDKASNEALMNLANGTFELAQQVEFFAVTVYRIQALTFSLSETESKIKSL